MSNVRRRNQYPFIMFGLFKTPDHHYPSLGTLRWSRGYWRGEVSWPGKSAVPLVLGGTRKGPDQQALQHAMNLPADFLCIEPQLKQALYDHYEPYAEAVQEGHLRVQDGVSPKLSGVAEAFALAEPEAVLIVELDGELATEVCYRVPWDEEHTLGARFRGRNWVELCGSTLIP